MTVPLRVCRVCGAEAFTIEDLESFITNRRCLHGRQNRCKRCQADYMRKRHYAMSPEEREELNRRKREEYRLRKEANSL